MAAAVEGNLQLRNDRKVERVRGGFEALPRSSQGQERALVKTGVEHERRIRKSQGRASCLDATQVTQRGLAQPEAQERSRGISPRRALKSPR